MTESIALTVSVSSASIVTDSAAPEPITVSTRDTLTAPAPRSFSTSSVPPPATPSTVSIALVVTVPAESIVTTSTLPLPRTVSTCEIVRSSPPRMRATSVPLLPFTVSTAETAVVPAPSIVTTSVEPEVATIVSTAETEMPPPESVVTVSVPGASREYDDVFGNRARIHVRSC